MDEEDKKVTEYLIPANVSAKFEFFEGFGWYELKIVVIACLIGVVFYCALGTFKKTIYVDSNNDEVVEVTSNTTSSNIVKERVSVIPSFVRLMAVVIPGAIAFLLVKKDPSSGMSLMFMVRSSKEFHNKQKRYLYKYNSGSEG